MRLINCTSLKLEEFLDEGHAPKYAILSHTWGDQEVSFKEFKSFNAVGGSGDGAGAVKIKAACRMALQRSYNYIWIDTCCIDKRSSAELSEAINSMYRWYKKAQECFVYLDDFECKTIPLDRRAWDVCAASRWFSRGWTLQELIAPGHIRLYDQNWLCFGEMIKPMVPGSGIAKSISIITGIHQDALEFKEMKYFSVAQRMSWASNRTTSRGEDVAYCLLGLLNVNMPLLYGEGQLRAFRRLQEEIIKNSNDMSIFASEKVVNPLVIRGIMANLPVDFRHSGDIEMLPESQKTAPEFSMTNKGLRIETKLFRTSKNHEFIMPLNCGTEDNKLCIVLRNRHGTYYRSSYTYYTIGKVKEESMLKAIVYIEAFDEIDYISIPNVESKDWV